MLYRLRRWGEKLPDDEVKARPQAGRLVFGKIPGTSQNWARLMDGGRELDQLRTVTILQIDGGVLLSGWEQHPGRGPTRQTWYCLPGLMDDMTMAR